MKKKKTVSTPKPRHFHSQKVDRYCLQHQEEDSEGDVKTELYKVCSKSSSARHLLLKELKQHAEMISTV